MFLTENFILICNLWAQFSKTDEYMTFTVYIYTLAEIHAFMA